MFGRKRSEIAAQWLSRIGQAQALAGDDLSPTVMAMHALTFPSTLHHTIRTSALGQVLVVGHLGGLVEVWLGDDATSHLQLLANRYAGAQWEGGNAEFHQWADAVVQMAQGVQGIPQPPVQVLQGTAFQYRVWRALRSIAPGQTWTYAQLAQSISQPLAVRAVASACAANPVAVVVPCHRVVRSDGGLGGYRWGLQRKRQLLANEAAMAVHHRSG